MTEGRYYRVDFVTFSWILGFGEEKRGFTYIHDEARAEIHDIAYMWINRRSADGKINGLKSYYYILNNLIRHTINPKDRVASDLNGKSGMCLLDLLLEVIGLMSLVSCGVS